MIKLNITPLSVNKAWKGRRYKTPEYKMFEKSMLYMMPSGIYIPPFKISFIFGFSNVCSDLDNPIKLCLDLLQKKYNFDDKEVYELSVKKEITKKSKEFIKFKIETIEKAH
jgi:Holliday junction resolvase RusA-like endonuclease